MTTLHIRPRFGRRTRMLGLGFSLGLIFGASEIIRLTDDEPAPPVPVTEICDDAATPQQIDPSAASGVHPGGQARGERNL